MELKVKSRNRSQGTLFFLSHVDVKSLSGQDLKGTLHRIHRLAILEVPSRHTGGPRQAASTRCFK